MLGSRGDRVVLFALLLAALGGAAWVVLLRNEPTHETDLADLDLASTATDDAALAGSMSGGPTLGRGDGVLVAGSSARGTSEDVREGDGISLVGRVVDESRRPVGGARVEAVLRHFHGIATTSHADGRFELRIPLGTGSNLTMQAGVLARHGDASAFGLANLYYAQPGQEIPIQTLVLRPGQALQARVVHRDRPLAGAPVVVLNGVHLMARLESDADGLVTLPLLPPGQLTVAARGIAPGQGRTSVIVTIPRVSGSRLELDVGDERRLPVTVKDRGTGKPIPGARILLGNHQFPLPPWGIGILPEGAEFVTDTEGRVEVTGLAPSTQLMISATAPGYPSSGAGWGQANVASVPEDAEEATLELDGFQTVRFRAQAGSAPIPEPGTPLIVAPRNTNWITMDNAPPLRAEMEKDHVVIHGLHPVYAWGTVRTDDGRSAHYHFQLQPGRPRSEASASTVPVAGPITFETVVDVAVRAVDSEGRPLPGEYLVAFAGANGQPLADPVRTDGDGIARWRGVSTPTIAIKRMRGAIEQWYQRTLLEFDPKKVVGVQDVVITDGPRITIAVHLDGTPRLPSDYTLMAANVRIESALIEEVPDRGELHVTLPPISSDPKVSFHLAARGYLGVTRTVDAGELKEGARLVFEMQPSGTLDAVVVPPDDGPPAVVLERLTPRADGKDAKWVHAPSSNPTVVEVPSDPSSSARIYRFEGLTPGRYRVAEQTTGLASDDGEVVPGAAATEVHLDLTSLTWIEGEVVVPAGYGIRGGRVSAYRSGPGDLPTRMRSSGVSGTGTVGTFKLRSIEGELLAITPSHPLLVPATKEPVIARGGDRNVRLSLAIAGGIVFRLTPQERDDGRGAAAADRRSGMQSRYAGRDGTWVTLVRDDEVVRSANAMLIDGVHRVGGIEGGTYRVVIEAMGFAPYERAGVVVPETGDTDLGTIEFPLGSTVRVRVSARAASETDAPRYVWCNATPIESLTNRQGRHAQAQLKGGDVIDITGLGAGRWKISVASHESRNKVMETLLNQDVEVDGVRDLVLDVPGP